MYSFYVSCYRGGYFSKEDLDLFLSVGMMTRTDYDLAMTLKDEADANHKKMQEAEQASQYPSN